MIFETIILNPQINIKKLVVLVHSVKGIHFSNTYVVYITISNIHNVVYITISNIHVNVLFNF